jgi:hypothetical protein
MNRIFSIILLLAVANAAAPAQPQTSIEDVPASVVIPVIHLQKVTLPAIVEYELLLDKYEALLGGLGVETTSARAIEHWSLLYQSKLPHEPDPNSHLGMMWKRVIRLAEQGRWEDGTQAAEDFRNETARWLEPITKQEETP